MKIFGVVLMLAGFALLASIVTEAEFLSWATGDFFVTMLVSLVGLAMMHAGWRLFQAK